MKDRMLGIVAHYIKTTKIEIDLGIEILSSIVKRFGLGIPAYMSLIDDLESNNSFEMFKEGLRAEKRAKTTSLSTKNGVLSGATQFLNTPSEMLKVCMLSKAFSEANLPKLKKRVLEEEIVSFAKRVKFWKAALGLGEPTGEFERLKAANLYLDKNTEDVIKVDVQRTFSTDKEFDKDRLFVLLRCGTLALQNSAGYCQGMNYIGGMLLYMGLSDAEAFEIYVALIQKKLGVLFENNFEQMKAFFYVLENVLLVCAPEVAAEFRQKKIEAGFFCSSWFITLFSSSFQYTRTSPLCLNIVDMFIADGFKAIFKVIVAILTFNKHRVIGKTFEETMEFLSDVIQGEIFRATHFSEYFEAKAKGLPTHALRAQFKFWEEYEFAANIKKVCKSIRVTNTFISKLQERYFAMRAKLNRL